MNKFLKDLSVGNKGELAVEAILAVANINSERGGRNPDFDLKHNAPVEFTSEVKFDLFAARSGNIAIEFFNPKQAKPSGINVTKAHLWFHVITNPSSVWVTTVNKLKEYIAKNPPHRVIACGGDDNASLYLYRQDKIFEDIFHRVDDCPADKLIEILHNLLIDAGCILK